MPFNTTIIYPNTPTLTFNMSYYLSHHFPLVEEKWSPHGLLDWKVVSFAPGPDGKDPPFKYGAVINWKDKESFTALMSSGEPWDTVMGDIPNFSNTQPTLLMGDVAGSG